MTYFGLDGRPTRHKDGNAGWRARHDERGNQIEFEVFGLDGLADKLKKWKSATSRPKK